MHIHYHYPRPEPFSPYPPGGQVPDYAKWMKEQLALKQDKLTFDILPVEGSLNPVTSGGIYLALAAKASLVNGKVPAEQLPSYVDDVLEFASREAFPNPGESGVLYVAQDQNLVYRWTGTTYVAVVSRIDIDTMVTRLSSNPVASSGIWAAIWGSLNTTPTGYTSLYDWTLGTRASKTDTTLTDRYSDWVISFQLTDEQKESFRQYGPEEAAENDFALTIRNGTTLYVGNYNAAAGSPSEDGFSLLLEGGDARLGLQEGDTIATRTLIGYQLGSQTDKPLQPQGDYLTKDEVVEPSSTAVAGQAADAKATYEQLDAKLDKSGGTMTGGLTIKNAALSLIPQRLNEGTSVVMQGETVDVTTPDPETQTFNHRTLTWPSATGTLATTADATLTPVYSEWVCNPAKVQYGDPSNPTEVAVAVYKPNEQDVWAVSDLGSAASHSTTYMASQPYDSAATSLTFTLSGFITSTVTATRAIVGYVLGTQTGKQLQPKGEYAPASNIAKAALASDVQTSLGKADTALQTAPVASVNGKTGAVSLSASDVGALGNTGNQTLNGTMTATSFTASPGNGPFVELGITGLGQAYILVEPTGIAGAGRLIIPYTSSGLGSTLALAADVPYDLGTPITIDSNEVLTDDTDPSNPITYAEVTLLNRTANVVQIDVAIDELRVTFPTATDGKVRDFELGIYVGDGTAALAAPALVVFGEGTEGITLMNPDGTMPELADGTATMAGLTLLYFSEVATSSFLVKGEQVQEITQ